MNNSQNKSSYDEKLLKVLPVLILMYYLVFYFFEINPSFTASINAHLGIGG